MRADSRNLPPKRSQRGFGMVEILVGVLIGLLAVIVMYQVFTVAEGFKRNTTGIGEAQQAGLFSMFFLGLDLANAGSGMVPESPTLASCSDPGGTMPTRFAKSYRPLPVVVADSGADTTPDTFVLAYSSATTLSSAAPFTAPAVAGAQFQVQSPGGFHPNDLVVAISQPGSPTGIAPCPTSKVTAVALTNDNQGDAILTQTPVDPAGGMDLTDAAKLLNMGPCNRVQKVMYSVALASDAVGNKSKWDYHPACGPLTPCILYSTPLLDTSALNCGKPLAALNPSPIVTNIVNMKVQYGIDTDNDLNRTLDTWVPAKAGGNGDWSWQNMMSDAMLISQNGGLNGINQIRAVRIGIVVQSEQFDQSIKAGYDAGDPLTSSSYYKDGNYNWVLFDCSAHDNTCPGRLTGSIAAQTDPPGNWRFRTYETVIPLRSAIFQRF